MAEMGRFCKAYPLHRFREFAGWPEQVENAGLRGPELSDAAAGASQVLPGDTVLYLQENFVVTGGVMMDEHVVYDEVTPEWVAFCTERLNFVVPPAVSEEAEADGGTRATVG